MKIGASTLAGLHENLEDILDFIENLGLEYAELVHQFPYENIDADFLQSYNLKYSIHSPFMDVNIASLQEKSRSNSIEQIKNSIDLANKIDAECVVVHPGLMPFLARPFEYKVYEVANSSIKELGDYGKDLGVNVSIENMPTFEGMIYKDMKKLDEILREYEMSMTLDIGHANHVGYSADEMYFDSIKHIHAHDNYGDDDSHLALGEGSIDLKRIINTFESKNYDGIYIIEVNDKDSIKKSYEFIKKNF
ncbi:sugar phosphate isomerase/epimerase [Methanobrevibacter sp.]|uniref:sugar phosphate isomerase/epimerase family protein n=1 Tax=Methanobrevibacter sp. TaxID=66852 RepID=UPI0026E0ABCF|nr:sugar phosphate isomerase/epimerase [Methanobrevibacter sp.]MDO5859428.1 sugar phosphate isomerase/epimerase [Methanobrevibacter sp.]